METGFEEKVVKQLQEKKTCSVYELASSLFVSESTIRRILSKMEQKGIVTRTFGGVLLNSHPFMADGSFALREKENIPEKKALVKIAASFIRSNMSIFLDSSTTTLQIVPLLSAFENLFIVTNGIVTANEIVANTKHRVTLLGGDMQPATNSVSGSTTEAMLSNYHAAVAIMSVSGIDADFGISEQTESQALIKRIMIANSDTSVVLVGDSKVDRKSVYRTTNIKDVGVVISTNPLPASYKNNAKSTTFLSVNR
jgi:DeoR/GlpR family transcriptional regulator of sugar metabolism